MTTTERPAKPLGIKAYGHIAHLSGSRMGPGDHHVSPGQERIATERVRDRHDIVIVQEKLDGSCTAVARIGDDVVALGRSGYLASSSPYRQHHFFADWVADRRDVFLALLADGERACGEWLAQAHGTRYDLTTRAPWVLFDIIRGGDPAKGGLRTPAEAVRERAIRLDLRTPATLNVNGQPIGIPEALKALGTFGHYGAQDPVEGAVWRVERKGVVDFLCKYVRPDKVDGAYLPDVERSANPGETVWNWQP